MLGKARGSPLAAWVQGVLATSASGASGWMPLQHPLPNQRLVIMVGCKLTHEALVKKVGRPKGPESIKAKSIKGSISMIWRHISIVN